MQQVHQKNIICKQHVERLNVRLDKVIQERGSDGLHGDLLQIMKEKSSLIEQSYPPDSFLGIFWEAQLQAASLKNSKSMRWDPLMVFVPSSSFWYCIWHAERIRCNYIAISESPQRLHLLHQGKHRTFCWCRCMTDASYQWKLRCRLGEACCSPHGWNAHHRSSVWQTHWWETKLLKFTLYYHRDHYWFY